MKILMIALVILIVPLYQTVFALQYTNYTDPSGWSIQYPSNWLVGRNTITGINGTQMSENESQFIPFDGPNKNVSIRIGTTSRVNNQTYTSLFGHGDIQLNCGSYMIAGHKACVQVFENIQAVDITTTINGNDYLFEFRGATQTEFENTLPIFMQMLNTFTPGVK